VTNKLCCHTLLSSYPLSFNPSTFAITSHPAWASSLVSECIFSPRGVDACGGTARVIFGKVEVTVDLIFSHYTFFLESINANVITRILTNLIKKNA